MTKDISERFESAQNNILLKASQVPHLATGATIGPHSNTTYNEHFYGLREEHSNFHHEPEEESHQNMEMDASDPDPKLYPVSAAIALQELDDLRKAEVKDSVNRFAEKITTFEHQLQGKMYQELRMLTDEMTTKSQLKKKLTESRINDDDLPISKVVSELINKYQQEKQKNVISKQKHEEEKKLAEEIENRNKYQRLHAIQNAQLEYRRIYENIVESTRKCKNCTKLATKAQTDLNELKELSAELNNICSRVKANANVEIRDVEACTMILKRATQLFNKLKEKIDEINEEERIEDEKLKQAAVTAQEKVQPVEIPNTEGSDVDEGDVLDKCICKDSYDNYLKYQKKLDDVTTQLLAFTKNKSLKQFILNLKIAINTPINAVSSLSPHHMRDKYNKIVLILRGNIKYQVTDISANVLELYYPFCIDYLCKKFISQGENLIPAKPEDAFAMASLILGLWMEFEDFGELLLAYFMKKCPYVIPAYWPQFRGQTDKEYYSSLGYRYNDDDVIEDHNMFLKRMNGIFMLYTAIVVSEPRHNKPHPHGIRYAWRWLAAALNLEPSPDITATLIHEFLELAGFKLSQHYGLQFWKLLHLLYTEYYPRIDKVTTDDFRGPLSRLKEFLEGVLKTRKFAEPRGMIKANFW